MAGQFSGAWRRNTLPASRMPLKPGIDPEHARPTDAADPQSRDMTGAPLLPDEWALGQYVQGFVPSEYVDLTPTSHEVGVGMLPGVDIETAQAAGGRARSEDLGAMDARDFERPRYQEDGSAHAELVGHDLEGTSPGTLRYQESGVGVGIDPYARTSRRIHRRPTGPAVFDMRMFGPEMRPRYVQTAKGSRVRGPVPDRQVNTPPEGAGVILRPDNWAAPVVRRSAPRWDQSVTTDQTLPAGPDDDFGLGRWGL